MTGGGVEAEYARDTWDARRLGIPVTVGHHSVSFARIPQAWLREAVKSWARSRLVGGISFGAIRRDVTGLTWFARFLDDRPPGCGQRLGDHPGSARGLPRPPRCQGTSAETQPRLPHGPPGLPRSCPTTAPP